MNFYYCILVGTLVLTICHAESMTEYPVSSQSYDRKDVPLSYKYNLIHNYTISKPPVYNIDFKHKYQNMVVPRKLFLPVNYQNVQYAPLPLRTEERSSIQISTTPREVLKAEDNDQAAISTCADENNEEDTTRKPEQEQKRNVIPGIVPKESSNTVPRKYVPGYNVDLNAVNKKLTQNGLYAINPNFLVKNKQVNIHYLKPNLEDPEVNRNNSTPSKGTYWAVTYQYIEDVKKSKENADSGVNDNEKRPFFYVKAPKLELNLARVKHTAQSSRKASINVNSSFRKLPSSPQEFFSNIQVFQPTNTKLYPVQKKPHT